MALFAERQAALLAAGYREERPPRRAGQRMYSAWHAAAAAAQADCGHCGHHGLRTYPFYRPSPYAAVLVIACPVCAEVVEPGAPV